MAVNRERGIATRIELNHHIADRKNDPSIPALKHPSPTWMLDPTDDTRVHIRMRERRISYLENRLDGAVKKLERDFDQSS